MTPRPMVSGLPDHAGGLTVRNGAAALSRHGWVEPAMSNRRLITWLTILLAGAAGAPAQEISGSAGVMGSGLLPKTSYAWQLDYRQMLGSPHLAWSASWLNEGHAEEHHRDGLVVQAWALPIVNPGDFAVGLGAGVYRYADTHFWPGDGYTNEHGWAPIVSMSATFYTNSPWFFRLTGNRVFEREGLQTNTLLAGIGYQLGWLSRKPLEPPARRTTHVITAMTGRTIVNSRSSEQARAVVYEYRNIIGRHWDWTLAWVDEGDPRIMRRNGVAAQVWVTDEFAGRGLSFGLGAGPYFLFSHQDPPGTLPDNQFGTAVMVSPTVSCELGRSWQARLTWNRVFSRNNSDVDVIVMGVGFRWGRR